jgi:hypothetical protein
MADQIHTVTLIYYVVLKNVQHCAGTPDIPQARPNLMPVHFVQKEYRLSIGSTVSLTINFHFSCLYYSTLSVPETTE